MFMPSSSLRWILGLFAVFLIALGADFHFSRAARVPADVDSKQLDVTDFMASAQAGELTSGQIAFRANATGLADLTAKRTTTASGEATVVRTTARLTDADLTLLRARRFTENDATTVASNRGTTARERSAAIARGSMQVIGLVLLASLIVVGAQLFAGRVAAFSPKTLKPATSSVKFASVAGCDEAKDEVHEVVEFLRDPARFRETGGRQGRRRRSESAFLQPQRFRLR
jgi:cell division protease FtsH